MVKRRTRTDSLVFQPLIDRQVVTQAADSLADVDVFAAMAVHRDRWIALVAAAGAATPLTALDVVADTEDQAAATSLSWFIANSRTFDAARFQVAALAAAFELGRAIERRSSKCARSSRATIKKGVE